MYLKIGSEEFGVVLILIRHRLKLLMEGEASYVYRIKSFLNMRKSFWVRDGFVLKVSSKI